MNFNASFLEKLRWRIKAIEHKYLQYRLSTNETVVSETEYGKIKGTKRISVYDKPYFSFEGIPYAQAPVGELRFKAPQRPTPWEDVRDCTETKEKAVQVHFVLNKIEGSEDCLYLNVYTNDLTPKKPRPVMVWIHGGGFIIGEAHREMFGPDYFMEKDVILITVQYRLGVLGFLSLKASSLNVPGNAALKDQVMALKWVKNNCAYFGGDSDCITVFGESAGAASTHFMSMTERTRGLFQRAIIMSGNVMAQWAISDCQHRGYAIAKLIGYKGEDNDADVYQFLMNAKARDLIRVEQHVLTAEEQKNGAMFAFGPTVEPYETPECVVPKMPKEMMKTAWGNSIPLLIGNTSYEGLICLPETKLMPTCITAMETCIPFVPQELRNAETDEKALEELGMKIKSAHVPEGATPNADNYMDMRSTHLFWFPMYRMLKSRMIYAGDAASVYIYRFDFDSEEIINPYRIMRYGRGVKGVAHADELTYLFWNFLARRMPAESREHRTIERMIGIWTKFALDGNPNNADGMDDVTWDSIEKSDENYKCLNISDDLKFIDVPENEKIKKWASMYEKHKDLLY